MDFTFTEEQETIAKVARQLFEHRATPEHLTEVETGDVRFDAVLPQTCQRQAALSTIRFFANGTSCGGTIALTRFDAGYEVRVNWLTGRVEIVSRDIAIN